MTHRRTVSLLVAAICVVAVLGSAVTAYAADAPTRSASEIKARFKQLQPVFEGSPYVVSPKLTAPYAAGSLKSGFLLDGLNAINYARFLAGMPDDVALDPTYTDGAQHGAVLLAVSTFSHDPPKPANMDADFYETANTATSSSNIGWGYSSLWDFNTSCLGDEDVSNIERVGHRRWLLNPSFGKTGMGLASDRADTWVIDRSRIAAVDYESVKWPSAGMFPVEMFGTEVPWSITLNPALYEWTEGRPGHTITLRRQRDGKVWTFTSADTDKSGEYFNFETSGYGVRNCFIFRPDPSSVGGYRVGDVFDVTLSGGITYKASGAPATVSYRTEFISHFEDSEISASSSPGGSISPSGTQTVARGSSKTYTITPSQGYYIDDVQVDGVSRGSVSSYTFNNVIKDHTIHASFEVLETEIELKDETSSALENGVTLNTSYGGLLWIYVHLTDADTGAALTGRASTVRLAYTYTNGGFFDGDDSNDGTYTSKTPEEMGGGVYRFRVGPTRKTWFRVRFIGDGQLAASPWTDVTGAVFPMASVTTPYGPFISQAGDWRLSLPTGRHMIYGDLLSYHMAGRTGDVYVYAYKYVGGEWVLSKKVAAKNYSHKKDLGITRYAASVAFYSADKGRWRVRAYFGGTHQNAGPVLTPYREFYVR